MDLESDESSILLLSEQVNDRSTRVYSREDADDDAYHCEVEGCQQAGKEMSESQKIQDQ